MKFFRLDLLTLLISLFIFNSCKNQDTIGLKPSGSGALGGSLVDTATVFTNTALDDSVVTGSMTKVPVGLLNDPVFGQTESDLITDLNLPLEGAYTLPVGTITIDSAVLLLNYADGFYGDTTSNYTINIYQLTQRQASAQAYYDNYKWGYNSGHLIGTNKQPFQPREKDSIKVTSIIPGAPDTAVKIAPQLRIPIDPNFINTNLFQASATTLASNLIFKNIVKGLFITMDKTKNTGVGGTIMFKAPADSALAVYIRAKNGSVIDTTVVYLDVTQHSTQISHTYSTKVQNALNLTAQNAINHTNISDSVLYLQGTAGLRGKISFPYLSSLFKSVGNDNVIINRAELVVTPVTGSDIPSYLVPQPKLTLYRYDIAHTPIAIEDANSASGAYFGVGEFGGYYLNATPHSPAAYHFLVTAYIQQLLANQTQDYGTYIAAVDTTNTSSVDIAPTAQTAGRVLAGGNNKKQPSYGIKLNVIYTKVAK
jgi:hypothetical protein